MATQNNKKLLHKKEPQMLAPALSASAAGVFMTKDPMGVRRTALLVASNTVQRLYDVNEDGWQELPSFALAGTFGAGACGTWTLWSDTLTATGGSTTELTLTTPISQFVIGKTVEFLTGQNTGVRVVVKDADVSTSATMKLTFETALPNPVSNGDTFRVDSGRYWVLGAGTLASGAFKSYDVLTGVLTTKSHTGLPSSWGTDAKMVATPSYIGSFATGTATSGGNTTLTNSGKTWTVNQWTNYQIRITAGTGIGQTRTIASNTSTAITVSSNWTVNPDNTSVYSIEGNDDYIYLMGNAAVTLYRYSISSNTWTTITPTVARSVAPNIGMGANWVMKTGNADWANENNIQDGRWIYSFVGNGTSTLHRYDIALNKWELVTYLRASAVFTTGSGYDVDGGRIYIKKDATNRFYYYDIPGNQLIPFITDFYPESTAVVGDKIFTVTYNDGSGDTINFLYYLLNTSNVMRRVMLY